ncbi:hypothetical protein SPACI_049120 [Sporomusa acidovorans DSM 3132]|uniref:Uncharacterized protein n=1 Tax=Sporomusa acidovorans (strain ATCC 49682 / DSM 3132 / Mol) TaxID=1123286 RepID=A0ABZ3JAF1_SPOA4|nr:hypothetical protein SPACI_45580 [Sporomusa acidovorans DSM 3132]SDE30646.1 hypothetical protein SAMN04488499_101156 [Sporomusa acidovorans]
MAVDTTLVFFKNQIIQIKLSKPLTARKDRK